MDRECKKCGTGLVGAAPNALVCAACAPYRKPRKERRCECGADLTQTPSRTKWCAGCRRSGYDATHKRSSVRQRAIRSAERQAKKPSACIDCGLPIRVTTRTCFSRRCAACRQRRKADRMNGYYHASPERFRARATRHRLANPEKLKAALQRWRKTPRAKELIKVHQSQRAHKRRAGGGERILPADWEQLKALYLNRCAYCFSCGPLTMDHFVPLKRGGKHELANMVPACKSCNCSKGAKLLVEWRVRP